MPRCVIYGHGGGKPAASAALKDALRDMIANVGVGIDQECSLINWTRLKGEGHPCSALLKVVGTTPRGLVTWT